MRAFVRLAVLAAALASLSPAGVAPPARGAAARAMPPLILWAWERPVDLRELPPGAGVALLTQTLRIGGAQFEVRPRRQPLTIDRGTPIVAVTRIETRAAAGLDAAAVARAAGRIAATAALPQVIAVQVDFDATASERPLYRALLRAVRTALPAGMPLSMTALASWCAGDRWIEGLPVDEAVPMLFEMGSVDEDYVAVAESRRAAAPACRDAVGVSLAEPLTVRADNRRVYVFNPGPWTAASVARAVEIGR